MKNDNGLHCQEALDKNSGYSLHRGKGYRKSVVFRFGGAIQGGSLMKRREFTKVMGAVAAGLAAGSVLRADDKQHAAMTSPQAVEGDDTPTS